MENDLLELDNIRRESEDIIPDKVTDEWRKQEKVFGEFVDILVTLMRVSYRSNGSHIIKEQNAQNFSFTIIN